MTYQQRVWTKEKLHPYYPLYLGLDNDVQSSSSFSSTTSSNTIQLFQPLTMNFSYQEVVHQLQYLTHKYSNSSYLTQTQQSTHRRTTFINHSASSSSNSTTSSIPFTIITTPSYHDYTFTNNDYTSQHTINTNNNHLPPSVTPNITTRLNKLTTPDSINSNNPKPPTPIDSPTPSNPPPDYHSNTSNNDDYFLCNTEGRHRNLPFGDLITSQKDKCHTRVIFQNVNSLDLSSGHHIL